MGILDWYLFIEVEEFLLRMLGLIREIWNILSFDIEVCGRDCRLLGVFFCM